jgi:hypothetical protein
VGVSLFGICGHVYRGSLAQLSRIVRITRGISMWHVIPSECPHWLSN